MLPLYVKVTCTIVSTKRAKLHLCVRVNHTQINQLKQTF